MRTFKLLVLLSLLLSFVAFTGCDNNDKDSKTSGDQNSDIVADVASKLTGIAQYCEEITPQEYDIFVNRYGATLRAKGNTEQQIAQLKDTLYEDCLVYNSGYPACVSEMNANFVCQYNVSESVKKTIRDQENQCESDNAACYRDGGSDCREKDDACYAAINYPCKSEKKVYDDCGETNRIAIDDYTRNTYSTPKTKAALIAMGVELD